MAVVKNRNEALAKLQDMIDGGKDRAHTALLGIQKEWEERRDLMVRPEAMTFDVTDGGNIFPVIDGNQYRLTNHSSDQLLGRAALTRDFVETCTKYRVPDLLKTSLTTLMPKVSRDGILVRHISEQIKGILSSTYRRMDASPIFEAMVASALRSNFYPLRGTNTDTRYSLAFIDGTIYEPTPGEFIVYGIQLITGDYGGVALAYGILVNRIACDNLAQGTNILRQIHLGKRFDFSGENGPVIELSKKTHVLDMRTVASGISDAVASSRKYIEAVNGQIVKASETAVDIDSSISAMKRKGFRKQILEEVKTLYNSQLPVEALPQERTAWRLSNCLSLIAKGKEGDEKHELEAAAFNVVAA